MNILILNWKDIKNPDVGGAEIILFELCKKLIRDGHKITWLSRKFAGCKESENIEGINILRKGNKFTVYWEAFKYYRNLKIKPDRVIDCINTICWQTPLYVPQVNRIAYINQLAKEVFFYELPFPLSILSYFLEKWEYLTYRNTKFICYSESVKQDLLQFGVNKELVHNFILGVDHERYFPGKKSKLPLFVFVARLVKMKRADLCINAVYIVSKIYPNIKLAIIGYGPEENNLRKQIQRMDLSKNVSIINKNNLFLTKNIKDEKIKYLQQSWALLLPSVKEGWGMVITEAAACQTPSIVSNVTGLSDSVVKNKTGLILSKDPTAKELSDAIIAVIEDNRKRLELGKNAVLQYKKFTWSKSYQQFLHLIED